MVAACSGGGAGPAKVAAAAAAALLDLSSPAAAPWLLLEGDWLLHEAAVAAAKPPGIEEAAATARAQVSGGGGIGSALGQLDEAAAAAVAGKWEAQEGESPRRKVPRGDGLSATGEAGVGADLMDVAAPAQGPPAPEPSSAAHSVAAAAAPHRPRGVSAAGLALLLLRQLRPNLPRDHRRACASALAKLLAAVAAATGASNAASTAAVARAGPGAAGELVGGGGGGGGADGLCYDNELCDLLAVVGPALASMSNLSIAQGNLGLLPVGAVGGAPAAPPEAPAAAGVTDVVLQCRTIAALGEVRHHCVVCACLRGCLLVVVRTTPFLHLLTTPRLLRGRSSTIPAAAAAAAQAWPVVPTLAPARTVAAQRAWARPLTGAIMPLLPPARAVWTLRAAALGALALLAARAWAGSEPTGAGPDSALARPVLTGGLIDDLVAAAALGLDEPRYSQVGHPNTNGRD